MDVGIWVAAFWQGVVFLLAMYLLLSVVWGAALARWARYPLWMGLVLGVFVPVFGPAVAAVVARTRRPRGARVQRRSWWGRWEALLLLVPIAGLVLALVIPWWRLAVGAAPDVLVYPGGHFLDVLVVVSAVFYVAAIVAFVAADLAHLGAVLLIGPVAFWAGFLWLVFSVTDATQRTLGGVAAMSFTVGDALEMFGVDLGSVAVPGVTDADVTDLADQVRLGVGDGWYVMAVVIAVTAVWMVRQAFRRVVVLGPPVAPAADLASTGDPATRDAPGASLPDVIGSPWMPTPGALPGESARSPWSGAAMDSPPTRPPSG